MTSMLPRHFLRLHPHLQDIQPVTLDGKSHVVLFLSATDGANRATVITATGTTAEEAWRRGFKELADSRLPVRWLRVDWVEAAERQTWQKLRSELGKIKRNYFRLGISLDPDFTHGFLETELNANAMLYGGPREFNAVLNEKNFRIYAAKRHGLKALQFEDDAPVWVFTTKAVFIGEDGQVHQLEGQGLNAGRRMIDQLGSSDVRSLIESGSRYLATQVLEDGRFHYGWHPCFDRPISSYNSLRHASSLYSMLEAWEVTRDEDLKAAIDRSITCLTSDLIRRVPLPTGEDAAFLVDTGAEIKLGGNAVAILALVKHAELTGARSHLALLEKLAAGIVHMQDEVSGQFQHVLNYPDLDVKQSFRIIYYDGEAAFGLMRLYGLTGDPRWLAAVEKAFDHFIAQQHWKANDHWLSYCVNELTLHRPEERYFRFGLDNFRHHLDFVLKRITTFPTLLELMMAAEQMVARLCTDPARQSLLDGIDIRHFYKALHARAHYLLNGHFWPELAMFYANPAKIVGSFFIRHHAFRVRIDDVEHYLSGFVAYQKYLLSREIDPKPACEARLKQLTNRHWSASDVERATGGRWLVPPPPSWSATGLCVFPPTMQAGEMVAVRIADGEKGVAWSRLCSLPHQPAAIIAAGSHSEIMSTGAPILLVPHVGAAILALGQYARRQMAGKIVAVTGSAGKTTTVAMLAHVLGASGAVGQTRHNANLPHGIAWNLASIPWDTPNMVLELAIGSMAKNSALAQPDVAIFTNILPAHLEYHQSLASIAERKSAIFQGMPQGSVAVLNRDMAEWDRIYLAALSAGLKVVSYGKRPDCDAQLLNHDAATGEVTARFAARIVRYRMGAAGEHMALNSLAVLAGVQALGQDLDVAISRLGEFLPLPGRGQALQLALDDRELTVLDESYNANPGSMEAALALLGSHQGGRRIAVLGEMLELGEHAADYHSRLAPLIAQHGIDRVHVIGDLFDGFWDALAQSCRGIRAHSLEALREGLIAETRSGDVLLFKGSHGTRLHELVDWLKEPSARRPAEAATLLYDMDADRVLHVQGESAFFPPASLTKLLTLCLIDQKLRENDAPVGTLVKISDKAPRVNSHWGFAAGESVQIADLMRAAMVVSANEAANALAEWHSGSCAAFTDALNRRAAQLGLKDTRFASPSGLGRDQRITVHDALSLALHVQREHPLIAALASTRQFNWRGKVQKNTNSLLARIEGADGLKTGRLDNCFNLIFSIQRAEGRRLAIVLGAKSKLDRDDRVIKLLNYSR